MTPDTKFCPGCRKVKAFGDFGRNRRMSDGLQRVCKTCHNEESRGYRQRHPERVAAAQRSWAQRHKTERAAYFKAREQDPAVKARQRELARKRRQANPEKARADDAAYRQLNREKIRQRAREKYVPNPIPSLPERLAAKIEKTDGCWLWTGATIEGYGKIQNNRKQLSAHRVSYELHIGPIPPDHDIVRTCGRLLCVRPEHLVAMTRKQRIARDRARAKSRL